MILSVPILFVALGVISLVDIIANHYLLRKAEENFDKDTRMKFESKLHLCNNYDMRLSTTKCETETEDIEFCVIDLNELQHPTPLLLYPGTTDLVRPSDKQHILVMHKGARVYLACAGRANSFSTPPLHANEEYATCEGNTIFKIADGYYDLHTVSCKEWPEVTEKSIVDTIYSSYIIIGHDISSGWVDGYDVSFDKRTLNTRYTKFVLTSYAMHSRGKVARIAFKRGNFYDKQDPNIAYGRNVQQTTIAKILDISNAELYISNQRQNNNLFLSRGHLVARADFFYGAQKLSTFFYTNTAPQWQTLNCEHWCRMEENVRNFAGSYGDLTIYTGTYGLATLPNNKKVETSLYLGTDGKKLMPVPKFFWKIIYDPVRKAGIAFVSLNNIHQKALNSDGSDQLCTNICNQVTWLTVNILELTDFVKGYSYCCEIADLQKTITDIPLMYADIKILNSNILQAVRGRA